MSSKLLILFLVCSGFNLLESTTIKLEEETCKYGGELEYFAGELYKSLVPVRAELIKEISKKPTNETFQKFLKNFASVLAEYQATLGQLNKIPAGTSREIKQAFDEFFNNQTKVNVRLIDFVKECKSLGSERLLVKLLEETAENKCKVQRRIGAGKNKVADCYAKDCLVLKELCKELEKLKMHCVVTNEKLKLYLVALAKYFGKLNTININCLK